MPMGDGSHCLGVHKATQVTAGIDFGASVSVEMEEDTAPRTGEVPAGLDQTLRAEPKIRRSSTSWPTRKTLLLADVGRKAMRQVTLLAPMLLEKHMAPARAIDVAELLSTGCGRTTTPSWHRSSSN